ncbi:MAG: flap endonuclease-1 [Candidatus Nanoarchaeia archaeon]
MGVNIAALYPKEEITFEDLQGKIIAIDAYNALYQFLSSIRQPDGTQLMDSQGRITSHLQGLLSRTANLMIKGIKLCYVFDGVPPALKLKEQQRRNTLKQEASLKYDQAVEEENVDDMSKYAKQFSRLTSEMAEESKELITALGLPVIEAPSEAEAQAAHMCKRGDAWAVASQDADALLFGAPRLIRNMTLSQKRKLPSGKHVVTFLELIELKKLLAGIALNQDQLIILGILVGTDFNITGIKGIGPKKALQLLKKEQDFDKIFSDYPTDFDWKEIYDLFKNIPVTDNYKLTWKPVDKEAVLKLLVQKHEFNEERVLSILDKIKTEEKPQKGLGDYF